jgi:hypothetical protein
MTLTDLTFLIIGLNSLVDHGHTVTIAEAEKRIEKGDVFEWLESQYKGSIDLSIYRNRPSKGEIVKEFQQLLGGYAGKENRKWGVKNNGICLLLAWTNEMIQQRSWTDRPS